MHLQVLNNGSDRLDLMRLPSPLAMLSWTSTPEPEATPWSFRNVSPLLAQICFWDHDDVWADHGEKLHDIPDEYLADAMPVAQKVAKAIGASDYNILQVTRTWALRPPLAHLLSLE